MPMKPLSLLVLAATATLSLPACARVDDDAAFGKKVRAYLLDHPEVLEEVAAKLDEKKQADAAETHKASLAAIPANRAALERDGRDLVANPGGTVTVVQFADYRCGYCKAAAPEIQALIKADPDVRVVFKEFPIFGGVSDTAAKIALTPQVKAQGLVFYHDWMAEKALDCGDRPPPAAGRPRSRRRAQGSRLARHRRPHRRDPQARRGPAHPGHARLRHRRRHGARRRHRGPSRPRSPRPASPRPRRSVDHPVSSSVSSGRGLGEWASRPSCDLGLPNAERTRSPWRAPHLTSPASGKGKSLRSDPTAARTGRRRSSWPCGRRGRLRDPR